VFGRRKQQQEEAAREAERRALFEELAKRPDTVCPFLGLENARTEYRDRVSDGHRCYAFGDPAELSAEQQQKVCLQRGYGNCPRYLRGVLVIPSEELEALRHPQPAPPPPVPAAAAAASRSGGGSRRGLLVIVLLLLLIGGGAGTAYIWINNVQPPVALETPSPSSATPSAAPSTTAAATTEPSPAATATPAPTPVVRPSSGPLPTPGPNDTPTGYVIRLQAGVFDALWMDPDGTVTGSFRAGFDGPSWSPVQRIPEDGDVFWRTLQGDYTGLAYSRGVSGDRFVVYQTFEDADGNPSFRELEGDEY